MIDIDALRAKPKRPEPKVHELDKVAWHIAAAMEDMRALPMQPLEREKFYNLIYNCLYQAQWLVVNDAHGGAIAEDVHPSPLGDDLNSILGG